MKDPWQSEPLKTSAVVTSPVGRIGVVHSVPSTTPVVPSDNHSAAMIIIANLTGVDVEIEFGNLATPNASVTELGKVILVPNEIREVWQTSQFLGVAKITALDAPTATDPRVVVNHENAYITP